MSKCSLPKSSCQDIFKDQIDKPLSRRITGTAMDIVTIAVKKPCRILFQSVQIVHVFVVDGEDSFLNLRDYLENNKYYNILVKNSGNIYTVTAQAGNEINRIMSGNEVETKCPGNTVTACTNSNYITQTQAGCPSDTYVIPCETQGGCGNLCIWTGSSCGEFKRGQCI